MELLQDYYKNGVIMTKINYIKDSELFKALAYPVRLKIVVGLMKGNNCDVKTIAKKLNLPQPTVSHHLSILKNNEIVEFTKVGVRSCYFVTNSRVLAIMKALSACENNNEL